MWSEYIDLMERLCSFTLFKINETPITPGSVFIFLLIFLSFVVLGRLAGKVVNLKLLERLSIDDGTKYNFERLTRYLIMIIGAIISFQFVGIDLSGLAVILGLFSVGIGFGLQNVTSNFIAGIILLFERPIKVGDRITIGEALGDVVSINMRSTTIRTIDNITIIVPNSDFISGHVTNWSYGEKTIRITVDVGVSYGSDLETVLRCLREAARENEEVLKDPRPVIHFVNFGDSAWEMKLRCWIAEPARGFDVATAIRCAIVGKFRENGVEIPFPQRDLHLRSPEAIEIKSGGK